jgi:hypothetical protein
MIPEAFNEVMFNYNHPFSYPATMSQTAPHRFVQNIQFRKKQHRSC